VLHEVLRDELLATLSSELETAGVLVCSIFETPDGHLRVLGREMLWVPESAYKAREIDYMSIMSEGYVPALGHAEDGGFMAIWLHTHPGEFSTARPSKQDVKVDQKIADLFRLRTGSEYYGAIVIALTDGDLSFCGHLDDGSTRYSIDRLWSVGRRFRLTSSSDASSSSITAEFDRNVRAFGGGVQKVLSGLQVGIVGCGGTGSAVAEQLVRLGVRHFYLADPDTLSESNVTRVYGSTPQDVGSLKVETLANHLLNIAPNAEIALLPSMVTNESTARRLTDCDVIFGCSDDNAGRLVLSRLSTYFLVPVIDCGVLLSSDAKKGGQLRGIDGRITTLIPGAACLVCRGRIDLQRASSELLTPEERVRLANEGYAPALGEIEPAVVTFTTMVSALAVSELLGRLIGFGPDPAPSEILVRIHDHEISTNDIKPRVGHYCSLNSFKLGLGMTQPFLEQTWG